MKHNCELPKCMMDQNIVLNDYDFVLFHLYCSDTDYKQYYLDMRSAHPEDLMILDNSAYEFFVKGGMLDLDAYKSAIEELKPDIYILPDRLMDKDFTLSGVRAFLERAPSTSRPMGVLQGATAQEMLECVHEYKELGIEYVAVPFHNSFFREIEPHPYLSDSWRLVRGKITDDDRYALGRIQFILDNMKELNKNFKYVHILGSHNPLEAAWYKDVVDSMDTGYPVKCAIAGCILGEERSKPDIIIDDFFKQNLDDDTKDLIARNIRKFEEWCL